MSGHKANIDQTAAFQIERSKPVQLEVRIGGPDADPQYIQLEAGQWVHVPSEDVMVSVRLKSE